MLTRIHHKKMRFFQRAVKIQKLTVMLIYSRMQRGTRQNYLESCTLNRLCYFIPQTMTISRWCLKSISANKLECGRDVYLGTLRNSRSSVRQTITCGSMPCFTERRRCIARSLFDAYWYYMFSCIAYACPENACNSQQHTQTKFFQAEACDNNVKNARKSFFSRRC